MCTPAKGYIGRSDFKAAAKRVAPHLKDVTLDIVFDVADGDRDNRVRPREFHDMMVHANTIASAHEHKCNVRRPFSSASFGP